MRRTLCRMLWGVCVLLLAASVICWIRSYKSFDELTLGRQRRAYQLLINDGGLGLHRRRSGAIAAGLAYRQLQPVPWGILIGFAAGNHSIYHEALGFRYLSVPRAPAELIVIPFWFITLLLALIAGAGLRAELLCRRLRFRRSRELCPKCGYDLRATPERCPECGMEASKLATSRTTLGEESGHR